jgi:uncharacterized repeat protein (TIGR03806 family)
MRSGMADRASWPALASALALALGGLAACGSSEGDNSGTAGSGNASGMSQAGSGGSGIAGASSGSSGIAGSLGGGAGTAGSSGSGGSGGSGGGESRCAASKTDAEQPKLLSETGCVDLTDPSKAAAGLIPYSVNSPLWSDAAEKDRFVMIPAGEKIKVADCTATPALCEQGDDGHWEMPVGTVLVKNFHIGGKIIESRLLIRRTESTWRGFSYEWDDAETEATLLSDQKDRDLGSQIWHYPSRGQCLECHTEEGGRSLGPSTAQMDRMHPYEGGAMNQLEKFSELGLLEAAPKAIPPYLDPSSNQGMLDERARSYLQVNCAICHRPGGEFSGIDMRFTTPLAEMGLCNAPIERGMGDPGMPALRLVAGSPEDSAMSFRMHTLTDTRMPKIGSNVVDPDGSALIDAWIADLTCP